MPSRAMPGGSSSRGGYPVGNCCRRSYSRQQPKKATARPRTCQPRLLDDRLPLLSVRVAVAAAIPRAATWLCTAHSASLAQ